MIALVDRIEAEIGPLEVVVFNIGANVRFDLTETTAQVFSKVWEMACFAGFLAAREAARVLVLELAFGARLLEGDLAVGLGDDIDDALDLEELDLADLGRHRLRIGAVARVPASGIAASIVATVGPAVTHGC